MRRLAATLALALCLLGCDSGPKAVRVQLLTGVDGCWAGGETGLLGRLVVDADYPAAANCRYPWDLVDCESPSPPSPYCDRAQSP